MTTTNDKNGDLMLDVRDLTIHYETDSGVVHAVEGLNLQLGRGESLGFVGETGAGKTTTALGIMRLIPNPPGRIKSGEILFEGENLLTKSEAEMRHIRGAKIAMIFQDPMTSLNPVMTVDKQIAEMIRLHRRVSEAEALSQAGDMLELVGIRRERMHDYPHQFSGGMKQRVVIAIALACDPTLLIADEPTTALDVTVQAQILRLMTDLIHAEGCSLMLITHDLAVVSEIADRINVMYCGRIVESGPARAVIDGSLHPYTLGLINSIPDLNREQGRFKTIPGIVPNMFDLPQGCRFSPRCERAQDLCRTSAPDLRELEPGHCVACHFPIHREVRS